MDEKIRGFFFLLILAFSAPLQARPGASPGQANGPAWSELSQSMEKMHAEMRSLEPSGNDDIDFARLMLPHHQAAIDMAKAELILGKDPQMRRLAQEVIADQQSEIELMRLWLEQHKPGQQK